MTSKFESPTMEVKKEKTVNKKKRFYFFRDVKEELKKITWPTNSQLMALTKVVISAIFVMALSIYTADIMVRLMIRGLAIVSRWIIG